MAAEPVAVIGLGAMGTGLATSLLAAGFPVTVHNRTPGRTEELARAGAVVADSAAGAVREARAVLFSLSDERAVDAVLEAVGDAWHPDVVLLDTSTVSPDYSRRITAGLAGRGVRRVEACLLGNPPQAAAGELRVLTAGAKPALDEAQKVLDAIGRHVSYVGPTGNAATTKLVFNLLLGGQLAALAEAVEYGVAAGLDRDRLLGAIGESGFSSKVLSFRIDRVREGVNRPAAFRAALMAKDLRLGVQSARAAGVETPVLTAAAHGFDAVVDAGAGDADAAVLLGPRT